MEKLISISEIFGGPAGGGTVQGEGALLGKPTVFVRTGGCSYRCSWCDTLYAVMPKYRDTWVQMTASAIFEQVRALCTKPILVTLSGGDPAQQPLEPLLDLGHEYGDTFCIESQGAIAQRWFAKLDYLTLSPKPPSSGMETNWKKLDRCLEVAQGGNCTPFFKVVVFDDADYAYAHEVADRYPGLPLYLQTGNPNPPQVGPFQLEAVLQKTRWLVEKVTKEEWNEVIVRPQFHSLLWGNTRGV